MKKLILFSIFMGLFGLTNLSAYECGECRNYLNDKDKLSECIAEVKTKCGKRDGNGYRGGQGRGQGRGYGRAYRYQQEN